MYRDSEDAYVTGVGFAPMSENWAAPLDPSRRRDEVTDTRQLITVPVMLQPQQNGRYGYLIHGGCWDLLLKASLPGGISLRRLILVWESLPIPKGHGRTEWGHSYGGLRTIDFGDVYPWTEFFVDRLSEQLRHMGVGNSPFNESVLAPETLVGGAPTPLTENIAWFPNTQDPFSRLPWELLEVIALYLPTTTALDLRLASRSFVPLFSSFQFWRSRFHPDGERGFLFEVRDHIAQMTANSLAYVYRETRNSLRPPPVKNYERVWGLTRMLAPLIEPEGLIATFTDNVSLMPSEKWIRLASTASNKRSTPYKSPDPTRVCSVNSTELSLEEPTSNYVKVGIAVADAGEWDYITGIKFIDDRGNEKVAGYGFKIREVRYNLQGFLGFRVAMGSGGVRALQVIDQQGDKQWAGRIEGMPQSDKLVVDRPVASIMVEMDVSAIIDRKGSKVKTNRPNCLIAGQGYKITALSIKRQSGIAPTNSLRNTALWYPSIPPKNLYLNEPSYAGGLNIDPDYEPLSWILFGGERGSKLSQIEGILPQYRPHFDGVQSLQFMYRNSNEAFSGDSPHRLGRCCTARQGYQPVFQINGSGGERINSIGVGVRSKNSTKNSAQEHPQGYLVSLSVSFNSLWTF